MLIFVYGSLKRNHGNHRYLSDRPARFVGAAVSVDTYAMINVGFPIAALLPDGHRIAGEVFDVDEATVRYRIDRLEGHPRWYRREERQFNLADGTGVTAWIYLQPYANLKGHNYARRVEPNELGVLEWGGSVLERN